MAVTDYEARAYEESAGKPRSFTDVMLDVVNDMSTLFRKEVQLAQTEVSEKLGRAVAGLAFIVVGAVLVIPALVILLDAAVAGLMRAGLPPYWAALIVGGVVLIIGIAVLAIGANRLRFANLAPTKTIEQLQRDADVAKRQGR